MCPADLPDDPALLQAMIASLHAELARKEAEVASKEAEVASKEAEVARLTSAGEAADAEIKRLSDIIAALQRHRFGTRSEKLADEQLELALEELEAALAVVETELEELKPRPRAAKPRRVNRGQLPAHLPRIEQVIEPESTSCPCCSGTMHVISEDVAERLDVVPASFRVLVTRRPKYACRACEAAPVQAPARERIIAGGLPTEATIAHVVVSKFADHLPLYRQAQIYARQGIELDRSTLADWVGRAAWWLTPLRDHLLKELKASGKLFADETTAPVLDPGRGRTKTGQIWAYARDDRPWGGTAPPAVAYVYEPDRTAERPIAHLSGFAGVLQVDGYAGYKRIGARNEVSLAFCWAHVRRGFFEQKDNPLAADVLRRIGQVYAVEEEIRGQAPATRVLVRQDKAAPLIGALKHLLEAKLPLLSKKSKLAEAIRYALTRWEGLTRFLDDGCIELDNNAVERAVRPLALTRKNALFAGSDDGARHWAVIASMIETAKINGIDPQAWLTATLERLAAGHSNRRLAELMPWAYSPASNSLR